MNRDFLNIANYLASKNIEIKIKPGSILNALSEFTIPGEGLGAVDSNSIVATLANKLNAELGLYRSQISPALKELIKEISTKAPIVESNTVKESAINVKEVKLNAMMEKLVQDGTIKADVTDYGTGCSIESGIVFPVDFEDLSDVSHMFKSSEDPATELLDDVLVNYSNLDLKNFLSKFGVMIYSNYTGSELNREGKYDYRSFGVNNANIIFLIDNICLMYGYICHRLANKVATNVDVDSYTKQLKEVKADLEKLMSIYYGRLMYLEKQDAVVINNFNNGREDKEVWVLSSKVNEYLDEANISAWDSINATSPCVAKNGDLSKVIYKFPFVSKSTLLAYEEKLVSAYQDYINIKLIGNHNVRVAEVKKLILISTRYVWDKFVSDELKLIGCDPEVYENKSKEESTEIILKRTEEFLNKCKDGDLTQLNPDIMFYIIGKIFFPRTNFYKFSINTGGNKLFDGFSKVHPDNETTLSAILLLAETIINEFE